MSRYDPDPVFDLFEDSATGEVEYAKPGGSRRETMRVLIVVKASPNPSRTYGDTVCVAGVRIDRQPYRWIRLYPIPFRHVDQAQRFRKYEVLELQVTPAQEDPRAESFRPNLESIKHLEMIPAGSSWIERFKYLRPLDRGLNTCDLVRSWRSGTSAASLAVIKPKAIKRILVDNHEGWTEEHLRAMKAFEDQPALFGAGEKVRARPLEAPRFHIKVNYTCHAESCRGHESSLIDWEVTALDRTLAGDDFEEARSKVHEKYSGLVLAPRRDPRLIIGNIARYPSSYSILGVYPTVT